MAPRHHNDSKDTRGVVGDMVCVGAFGGSHGVKGDVKLRSYMDDPQTIFDFETLYQGADGDAITVSYQRPLKEAFTVKVEGVSSPEDAQALNGIELFVPRDQLPTSDDEDEFFLADLVGLTAKDVSGRKLGVVQGVENYGAEDLLDVVLDKPVKGLGRIALIPFRKRLVPTINLKSRSLTIDMSHWLEVQAMATPESQMEADDKADADE